MNGPLRNQLPLKRVATLNEYHAHGWRCCLIEPGSKGPSYPRWNTEPLDPNTNTIPFGYGVGLLHALSGTCSIDIDQFDLAKAWLAARGIDLDELLNAPDAVRIISGRVGSDKLICKMPESTSWAPSKKVVIDGRTILEFRSASADGKSVQDILPHPGYLHVHAKTEYRWQGDWRNLPVVPAAIQKLWQELIEADHQKQLGIESNSGKTANTKWTTIVSALQAINPDSPRDPWRNVGMALKHAASQIGNDEEAFAVFNSWSAQSPKYKAREMDGQWRSFKNDRPGGITLGTLFHYARETGWRFPDPELNGMFGVVQQPVHPEYDATPVKEQPTTAIHDALKVAFPDPFPGAMAAAHAALLPLANKPQPEMLTFSLLIGMASCVSGRYYFGNDQRANLFGIGVLETGGGKDYVRICGEKVANAGGATRIDMPASGEGLEDSLMSYDSLLMAIDEIGHMLAAANSNNAQAHHIKLKREILRLFTSSSTTIMGRAKAGLPGRRIDHPCLNILGFTTPAVLGRALTGNDVASGELPRYLMVFGREGVPLRRAKGKINLPDETLGKAKALKLALLFAGEAKDEDGMIEVKATVDGDAALDAAMAYFNDCPKEGGFGAELATRSYEKVERIAIVLAVWCEPVKPIITKEMVEWAVAFVIASNAAMNHFVETHMHSAACIADAETVVSTMQKVLAGAIKPQNENQKKIIDLGYVPRSLLLMRSKLDSRKFADAFDYLIQTERAELVNFPFTLAASGATRHVPALKLAGTATVSVVNEEKQPPKKLIGEE